VYGHAAKRDAETAKSLTLDEARRIARNIAKLPTLLGKGSQALIAMYLTQTQFDILRLWAQQTPQVQEAYLFGSYAQGEAHIASDVDIAIKASAGNWTALAAKWEQHLTNQLEVTVNIRTLANPKVREICDAFSVPLKR
jgi:predicted nucleotidyltransferase